MALNVEENLIVQSACTAILLLDLSSKNDDFVKSDFYRKMDSFFPNVKKFFEDGGIPIGNQGTMLMCLYTLLVLPKELISNRYQAEYEEINKFIPSITDNEIKDTYKIQGEYLRHIRNAIAHGRVIFNDGNPNNIKVTFKDEWNGAEFLITFSILQIPTLLLKLLAVHQKYIADINKK